MAAVADTTTAMGIAMAITIAEDLSLPLIDACELKETEPIMLRLDLRNPVCGFCSILSIL